MKKKLVISIDMDDAWVGFRNENSLSEAFKNIFNLYENEKYKPTLFIIGKDINKNKENLKRLLVWDLNLVIMDIHIII